MIDELLVYTTWKAALAGAGCAAALDAGGRLEPALPCFAMRAQSCTWAGARIPPQCKCPLPLTSVSGALALSERLSFSWLLPEKPTPPPLGVGKATCTLLPCYYSFHQAEWQVPSSIP